MWVEPNKWRENITVRRHDRKSAGPIVAGKRGNARGAKEPYQLYADAEKETAAWIEKITLRKTRI